MLLGRNKRNLIFYSMALVFVLVGGGGLLRSICLFAALILIGGEGISIAKVYNGKFCSTVYILLIAAGIITQTFSFPIIAYNCIIVFLMFLILLFVYLTRYPCASLKDVALGNWIEDIIFLSIWNTGEYFFGRKRTATEWEQEIKYAAGAAMAAVAITVMVILGIKADSNFSLIIYCFMLFAWENLYLISLIIILGACYSVVLYNCMTGLDKGVLEENPNWYYKSMKRVRDNRDSLVLDILLNNKAICVILIFIGIINITLFICRIVYFLHGDSLAQIFALEDQFLALLVLLGFEIGLMYIIRVKLLMDESQALDMHWLLAILASVSCILPWGLALIMYAVVIYINLISMGRSVGLYVLVIMILFLGAYARSCKRTNRKSNRGLFSTQSILAFLVVVVVWNSSIFPFYNINLFEIRNHKQGMEHVDPEELDIAQMAKAGEYAVPVLIRLLEWDASYGDEGKMVFQVAEEQILQIYYQEMDPKEVDEIMTQEAPDRLEELLEYMNGEMNYRVGFRGYCREKLKEVILHRKVETLNFYNN
ncbi:MAG: hypothetical protein K2M91_10690 [Lachnospiraceae bacterium]|nr:hypothetical protein [Lachnospiraceae bacterium]